MGIKLESERIRHNCGIGGIYAPGEDVTTLLVSVAFTLQPRGQEGAGICIFDTNGNPHAIKDSGLAKNVFDNRAMTDLRRHDPIMGVCQDRYSTSGSDEAWQPFIDGGLALVHNGNLTNAAELLARLPTDVQERAESDSWIIHQLILHTPGDTWTEKIQQAVSQCEGAYNFIVAIDRKLYAIRDPWGFRPLVIGQLPNGGTVVASETSAFAPIRARFLREVQEGEGVVIDENGIRTFFVDPRTDLKKIAHCIFEYVYISSPDSVVFGIPVAQVRYRCGEMLAQVDAAEGFLPDVIVPVQQSGVLYAQGYAREMVRQVVKNPQQFHINARNLAEIAASLVPRTGLVANPYAGRIFISPDDRVNGSRGKHRGNAYDISNKVEVVIDDSLLRGNAQDAIRIASVEDPTVLGLPGAREVHGRICSPPIAHPCFMGVDFATHGELLAHVTGGDIERMRERLKLTSLKFLTHRQLIRAVIGDENAARLSDEDIYAESGHCGACFTGKYPLRTDSVFSKPNCS